RLDQLHVLLRHRLRRQPGCFEGLCSFWVEPPTQELPVAELEQVPEPALNPHPAALAATVVQDADEHHVTCFGELLGGVVDLLPGLCPLSHPIEDLGVSPVRATRLNQARGQPKLYCGVPEVHHSFRASLCEGLKAATHDLHVLLRHRLLLQAEVCERVRAVKVDDEPDHLAVVNLEQVRSLCSHLADLHAARLATTAVAVEFEDA